MSRMIYHMCPEEAWAEAVAVGRYAGTADDRRDGVVGLAFALKQVAQLLLMCDGHDIGISIDTGDGDIAEDQVVSSTGSYNATGRTSSAPWVMQMVTFRAVQ